MKSPLNINHHYLISRPVVKCDMALFAFLLPCPIAPVQFPRAFLHNRVHNLDDLFALDWVRPGCVRGVSDVAMTLVPIRTISIEDVRLDKAITNDDAVILVRRKQ